ncbi:MAG: hypothetical protein ACKV2O_10175 [Acidimicrobiales bacterium]
MVSLLNDLDGVTGDLILVLDDYHVIEAAELHDAMAFLVDHAPPHVHLVLSNRADPPLPLARLRARGELLEIRVADLRFTDDEATSYLNESMGLSLTSAGIGALEARIEGWVAALQWRRCRCKAGMVRGRSLSHSARMIVFVVDYPAEGVLERQHSRSGFSSSAPLPTHPRSSTAKRPPPT